MKKTIAAIALIAGISASAQTKAKTDTADIEKVELFGTRYIAPEGLEIITRMPLKPRDQIQSISVLSSKVIENLGGLTVTDVVKNVPGVTQFASYGGTRESMTIRGYRGVPVLKNGVRMDSDFRTAGILTDMQGVETIQIIKGSAAITQGIGSGLGDGGGVINIVTKKPHFINAGSVGFRYGSWDLYRPFLDVQRVLDSEGRVAVRFNAAYQNSNSFRKDVKKETIYVAPSFSFRPDDKTEVNVEMDYYNADVTPDRGTINLGPDSENHLYEMPKDKFLGFATDYSKVETYNFATTATRKIGENLKLRAGYYNSFYRNNQQASSLGRGSAATGYAVRQRSISKSDRDDYNQTFQMDFIGTELKTGALKHTFQVGFDWTQFHEISYGYDSKNTDVINVLQSISNVLPASVDLNFKNRALSYDNKGATYGLMAQDVTSFNKYLKAVLGIRYSRLNGLPENQEREAWNPSLGLMISPKENINIFGSYTNTTNLRSANNKLEGGGTVGPEKTNQFEAGIKSDWLSEKLRFNLTLFHIKTDNLSYAVLNSAGNSTGLYGLAGRLVRKGVETEVIGRILTNLQVIGGYSYLQAEYSDSPAYMDGSAPMNTPKHTANGWVNYKFNEGALRGLDLGFGAYFVGKRPVDNFTKKTIISGHANSVLPGVEPFNLTGYTTLDAQVGYSTRNFDIRVFMNNLTNEVNYSSYYRGGYLDQIQPRNFSAQVVYKF